MMPSLSILARGIPRATRERGEDYFRGGRVRLTHVDDYSVRATVQGSELYSVIVDWDEEGISDADCDCPYAMDHMDMCKHMWAAVLAADAKVRGGRIDA